MVQDEVLKLKFDNSCGGKLFATQNDTGRIFTVQILSDKNNVVDVTGMSLRLYIGNQKEVSYCDGEIIDAEKGKFKLQLFNSQLKYPGIQQAQFILKKDDRKIGSKIFDIHIEEGVEAGSSMGVNLVIMYDEIKEAAEFLKGYDKTLEDAKKVDSSLNAGIKEGKDIREDLANYKEEATEIKNNLENTTKNVQNILNESVNFKDDIENIKNTLVEENTKAKSNLTNLTSKIAETEETATNLENKISSANTTKSELEETGSLAENIKKSLEGATTDANTIKDELGNLKNQGDVLSKDLTAKITDGKNLKSSFDSSMDNANSTKTILDESVKNAVNTNATLTETDDKAKSTETLIKDLMNQLEKTKDEVRQIIASGDLSKYVTDPKLQEVLKDYLSKNELNTSLDEKIDKTAITDDFEKQSQEKVLSQKGGYDLYTALSEQYNQVVNDVNELIREKPDASEIPTKLSQLINDANFKTETEIQSMIEKASSLKKEVVTSLPTTGKDDVIYLVKDTKGKDNNNYLEYLWLNGKYEPIGSTQVDLSKYATNEMVEQLQQTVNSITEEIGKPLDKEKDKAKLVQNMNWQNDTTYTTPYFVSQAVSTLTSQTLESFNDYLEEEIPKKLDRTIDKAIAPQDSNPNSSVWQDDNKYVTPKFLSSYVDLEISGRDETIQAVLGSKLGATDIQEFTQQELEEAFR